MIEMIEQISIDLSNYCSKQCPFCYNHSRPEGATMWRPSEVIRLATDCIAHGVRAVSLGGGEPFEYDGVFDIIRALYPRCYLTVTTNGLPLEHDAVWLQLLRDAPDKIHVTIHRPHDADEVRRVEVLIRRLAATPIKPGLNLLVESNRVPEATAVFARFLDLLTRQQIILVPRRPDHTPSARQLAEVAGRQPFQAPACLTRCLRPERFVSISWDKQVNHCSYAGGKAPLRSLDHAGLLDALSRVTWQRCGS